MSDTTSDDEEALTELWIKRGCRPEDIIGFAEYEPELQQQTRRECDLMREFFKAQSAFEELNAKWGDVPPQAVPLRVAHQFVRAHDDLEAAGRRMQAEMAKRQGTVLMQNFVMQVGSIPTDHHKPTI